MYEENDPYSEVKRLEDDNRKLVSEKRSLLREQDQRIRESKTRKDRIRRDPKFRDVNESLKLESVLSFWLRILFGSLFSILFYSLMYSIYVKLNVLTQLGNSMTYILISSSIALFMSFFIVKREAKKRKRDIKYRELHDKATLRQAAYEGISVFLNACLTVFGLMAIIESLPFGTFVVYYVIVKVGTRGIAWLLAKKANSRVFVAIGIVAIVFISVIVSITPLLTIIELGASS